MSFHMKEDWVKNHCKARKQRLASKNFWNSRHIPCLVGEGYGQTSHLWGFSIEHELADSYFQAVNYEDDLALGFVPLLRLLRLHREDAKNWYCRNQYRDLRIELKGFGERGVSVFACRTWFAGFGTSSSSTAMMNYWSSRQMDRLLQVQINISMLFIFSFMFWNEFFIMKSAQRLFCIGFPSDLGGTAEAGFDTAWPPSQRQHHWDLLARCLGCNGSASCSDLQKEWLELNKLQWVCMKCSRRAA